MTNAVVTEFSHHSLPDSIRWSETSPSGAPAASQARVEFRALGPVAAVVAGRPVDLGAPKQRALLALLVSQVGQPVPVDVILESLWGGHPPPSAMTSLHAYVANLRKLLEPDRAPRAPATVLRTFPRGYLMNSSVVDIDVRRFSEHATEGLRAWEQDDPRQALSEFEAGLALWRGPAYPEVAGAACVVPEVARLEELRLSVVELRCAALLGVGAHEMAVAELGAFTKAYPLREHGCELLSLALYRSGRQADALEALRSIQMRLAEELGLDPSPALQHLKRQILNQAPTLDRHPPVPTTLTLTASSRPVTAPMIGLTGPPFSPDGGDLIVGREATLRRLTETLTRAESGRGRVVTVSGEPGIGRTRLLQRFADQASVPTLWGTCPEHVAAPPLWPWKQVLRAAGTSFPQHPVPGPVVELLDRDIQPPADGVDPDGAKLRRFEAIVQYLTAISQSVPLVMILDQVHRADTSSLQLLAHLAESVPTNRLLLVASYRSDEAAGLTETLASLARREMMTIDLGGLTSQDVQTLASAILQQDVDRHTAEELRARTGGNPFFLRELIKLMNSKQRLDDPSTTPVPVSVRDVVLHRIARLPRPVAELLSVAAIVGEQFDIEIVAEVASVEIDTALEILDTAIAAGLIAEDQQRLGWFRFTPTLVAEALHETTGRLRSARLHRRISAVAARRGRETATDPSPSVRYRQPAAAPTAPAPPPRSTRLRASASPGLPKMPPHDGCQPWALRTEAPWPAHGNPPAYEFPRRL
nr:BTAD domain-containing putative transcriptional regulator [Micromonospora sp. DSM 115978]